VSQHRESGEESSGEPRPVTAAARRERRASGRDAAQQDESGPRNGANGSLVGKQARTKNGRAAQYTGAAAAGTATTAPKGRPTPARDRTAKRTSLYERFVRYLREVVGELRKVVWPNRKEMLTYTVVVLIFLVLVTGFVFGIDLGFSKMMVVIFS
jgi:preprotein translocase subunit SecE